MKMEATAQQIFIFVFTMATLKKTLFSGCLLLALKKRGITWLPRKLLHIPETNNE